MTEVNPTQTSATTWKPGQVMAMGLVCLLFGLAIGYLFRGSQPAAATKASVGQNQQNPHTGMGQTPDLAMPSLEDMKRMAEKKAQPLLEKLKSDPSNPELLGQVGNIYKMTHQFKEAIPYYDRALKTDPKNVALRTEMASCMYYTGDADAALSQLQQALQYKPSDANSLFNLGMIKLRGKQDAKGAVAAWQNLLKLNPQLSPERKAQVEKLISEAQSQGRS